MDDDDDYVDSDVDGDVDGGAPEDDDWTYDPTSPLSAAAQAGYPDSPYPLYPGDPDQMTDDERTVFSPVDDINSTAPPNPAGLQPLLTVGQSSPYQTGQLGVPGMAPTTYDTGVLTVPTGGTLGGTGSSSQGYGSGSFQPFQHDYTGATGGGVAFPSSLLSAPPQLGGDSIIGNLWGDSAGGSIYGGPGNDPLVSGGNSAPVASSPATWLDGVTSAAKPPGVLGQLGNAFNSLIHGNYSDAGQEAGLAANHFFGGSQPNPYPQYFNMPPIDPATPDLRQAQAAQHALETDIDLQNAPLAILPLAPAAALLAGQTLATVSPWAAENIPSVFSGAGKIFQGLLGAGGDSAAEADTAATGFRGSQGFELENAPYQPVRNAPGEVNGTAYSGHAFDQMQNRGIMPSVVDNAIETGMPYNTRPGTTGYYDPANKLRVIVNSDTGRVVTLMGGKP